MKNNEQITVYSNFRSNEVLVNGFEAIKTLGQYLYMNEKHSVVVNNGLCNLEIQMNSNLDITCKNLNFPDVPRTRREFSFSELISIISELQKAPAVEYPKYFSSRWEEICMITTTNVGQNKIKMER